jgi:hypothetical protein
MFSNYKLYFSFYITLFQNDGSSNDGDVVQLDEECAKVFAMDTDNGSGFDIHKFHDTLLPGIPRQYGEKDYIRKYIIIFMATYVYV